jgi:hypothetical protein
MFMSSPVLRPTPLGVALTLAGVLLAGSVLHEVHAQAPLALVASGLDNPRGLGFGPDGSLYVVEAGRGGTSSLCLPVPVGPPGAQRCYGATAAVTRITGPGMQERVVTGLPSLAPPSGEEATGPHDIQFGPDKAWVTIGLAANPNVRAPFRAAGIHLGSLVEIAQDGSWRYVVDLSAIEQRANPDGGAVDSNPYGGVRLPNGRGVIADAGANALLGVSTAGAVSTLAVFPNRSVPGPGGTVSMQAVPTTVVYGPDGNLYVGQLTGFPFPVGGARVYRVPAAGGTPVVVASGFTNIIDIAVNPGGVGYVLEHDADGLLGPGTNGRLVRVNLDGSLTVIASTGLVRPGGVAVGPDGSLYVTINSTSAGGGEVVRIVP